MVERQDISKKVKAMLIERLNLQKTQDEIKGSTYLFKMPQNSDIAQALGDSLNLDSIDSLEIIIGLEKNFGIKITDEELKQPEKIFMSVDTLTDFIYDRVKV